MATQATSVVSYPMSAGDGQHSYTQNSNFQRVVVETAKVEVKEAILDKLELTTTGFFGLSRTVTIADFGCSIGSNTLIAAQNIIDAVQLKYESEYKDHHQRLEFQVFFNDVVNNDFNTLFRKLPFPREFFAAGVPGGFQNRLLPKASLHIGHSSYALHWLSKIPDEVVDVNSPAWNKNSIHCTGLEKEVAKAFSSQFHTDMGGFLKARAQELVGGGLLLLAFAGLPEGTICSQTFHGVHHDILEKCLRDMVQEGLITREKLEAFNIPMYYPPAEELKALLEKNADFTLERFDPSLAANMWPPATPSVVKPITSLVRAVFEELVRQHFGDKIMESVFERFHKKLSDNLHAYDGSHKPVNIFIVLKKKTA